MRSETIQHLRIPLTLALLVTTALEGRGEEKRLAKVEFDQANLEEIVDYFRLGGGTRTTPRNILVDPTLDKELTVTLTLRDVTEGVAFAYVAELAGFDYREEQHAVRIFPARKSTPKVRGFLKRGGPMTWRRASQIQLPKVEFDATELDQVIADLTSASRQLDPRKKGLNIILSRGVDPTTPVTFSLKGVPLTTVLKYVADFARLDMRADGSAIVFMARSRPKPKPAAQPGS